MKRRQFIKLSSAASAIALTPFELQAALKSFMPFANCPDISNRKLVLIDLAGGNDGLNTVIPLNHYDTYSNLRPSIKVPESGLNKYITLDRSLQDNQQVGLHPALTGFKSLYDQGLLRIMQSVGYPKANKSHFQSQDLYATGNDGNSLLNGTASGWIGRFMELYYADLLLETFPLAVEMGSPKTSLAFHAIEETGLSLNITGQDAAGFYSVLKGLGGEPPSYIPNSDYGKQLEFINETDALSNTYANAISTSFNAGQNHGTYPDTDLANQLKTVAKLISGNLGTKIYMVRLGGFDTHASQIQTMGDVKGNHFNILAELSDAVEAFMNDLKSQNLDENIVGLTYSEFGRKAKENGNLGTDHGEIAPMFLFGKPVAGGFSGTNPDLSEATSENKYQLQTIQYDYRQTFTTLLQDFIGVDNSVIDATFFNHTLNESFTNLRVDDIIKDQYSYTKNCASLSTESPNINSKEWLIYPNPFKDKINLKSISSKTQTLTYKVFNSSGVLLTKETKSLIGGQLDINLKYLATGLYMIQIEVDGKMEIHKVLKI